MLVKGATGEEDPSHITCPLCVEYGPASVTPEMLNKQVGNLWLDVLMSLEFIFVIYR